MSILWDKDPEPAPALDADADRKVRELLTRVNPPQVAGSGPLGSEAVRRACAKEMELALTRRAAAEALLLKARLAWFGLAATAALGLLGAAMIAQTGWVKPSFCGGCLALAASGYLFWLNDREGRAK